jgi:hypothetical protein
MKISAEFLHNKNGHSEKENNTIHNTIKKLKCLEINLTKDIEDLCNINYKSLKKEIKDDIGRRDIPCSESLL